MDTERTGLSASSRHPAVMVFAAFVLVFGAGWGLFGVRASATSRNTAAADTRYPARVAVFGDSLTFEAEPYFAALLRARAQSTLTYDSFGGTAICDWLPTMRQVETRNRPQAVELEFSGNALTPCMRGYSFRGSRYYAKYRADTEAAIDIFVPAGAHVYLIGAPITRGEELSGARWATLDPLYADLAAADPHHVTYVDAGSAVEGRNHTYAQTLPCLRTEPCMGPVVNAARSNTVRAPDGVHFCPVTSGNKRGVIRRCDVYSSGAFRYSRAMVEALAIPA